MSVVYPVVILGSMGLLFGLLLSIASKVFAVYVDPLVGNILGVLPGANCGACGFPGCEGLANAIANGKAPCNACTIGGNSVAQKVATLMGQDAQEVEKMVAVVKCNGTCANAKNKYTYHGYNDCRYVNQIGGGNKSCFYGCLGCGTCKDVCPFDAITMVDGVAFILKDKCKACNKCIEICPKKLIELMPYKRHTVVKCNSLDKGKTVKENCAVGCIGCKMCEKKCPKEAITVTNSLAHIDYLKCVDCNMCVKVCPQKTIISDKPPRVKPTPIQTQEQAPKENLAIETVNVEKQDNITQ